LLFELRFIGPSEKADIEAYLKSSGLPHATLYLGAFLENYWKCVVDFMPSILSASHNPPPK
jgi:hypothetical protein